jgi:spore germination protein KC
MIIVFTLFTVGCKQVKHELNVLAIVLASGVDLTPEGKYLVTAQILNPKEESSSNNKAKMKLEQNGSLDIVVFSALGDTPQDAWNNMSTELGKTLFFAHSKFVVVGKNLAEAGLALVIDSSLRNPTTRPDYPLLVTNGKALDIMMATPIDEKIPSNVIHNLIKQQSSKGFTPVVSRIDFANALASNTSAPIAGVVELTRNSSGATFRLGGTAVFKEDKLIGFLNLDETRGFQWTKGNVNSGTITTFEKDNKPITFDILKSKAQIKPIVTENSVKMQINIKVQSNIIEMSDNLDPMKDYKVMEELAELQNKAIKQEVMLFIYKARDRLNADIFDFGGILHRDKLDFWRKIENNWNFIFRHITVEVIVDSSIERPGSISKPIK